VSFRLCLWTFNKFVCGNVAAFPATILEQLRRPCRPRHPYAVPRTSLQCVCTRRRICIAQLSPSREYALRTVDFPARNFATIELTHYPHGSGSRRRITFANSSPRGMPQTCQFQTLSRSRLRAACSTIRAGRSVPSSARQPSRRRNTALATSHGESAAWGNRVRRAR
jgi:hypothetical protein